MSDFDDELIEEDGEYLDVDDTEDAEPFYGDVDEEEEDAELEAAEEEEEPEAATPPPQPQVDQKQFNRIAYENRILQREQRQLVQRFNQLIAALQPKQEAAEEEEIPDPELDLPGHMSKRFDRLEQKLESEKRQEEQRKQAEAIQQEFINARSLAIQYRETNPEVYDQAVDYLTNSLFQEMAEEYPEALEEELVAELGRQAQARMIQWRMAGRNPGEELMKMAARRGFSFQQQAPAAPKAPPSQQVQRKNGASPKDSILQRRQKEQKARTISGLQGIAPGGKLTAKKILSMSDEDYDQQMRALEKQRGRKLTMAELIPDKVRRTAAG
jgi:hypothetical protein